MQAGTLAKDKLAEKFRRRRATPQHHYAFSAPGTALAWRRSMLTETFVGSSGRQGAARDLQRRKIQVRAKSAHRIVI